MKITISSSPLLILTVWGRIFNRYFSEFSNSTLSLKSCFFLLVIFPFFISDSIAQNFFPLKVGNIYQVEDDWWWIGPGGQGESGTDYYYTEVINDTVINNELFHYLFSNYDFPPFNPGHLIRYDSLQQKLFIINPNDSRIRLAVDFNTPADSHYISYITGSGLEFISEGISNQVVLGDTHFVYSMKYIPPYYSYSRYVYQFSNGVGFSKYMSYVGYTYGAGSSTHNIISAIINSVVYNPLILSVDTLYPTFDRPVDTFPFLLTIPYTASYSALIDSFYLDVQQLREDSLVQTKKYNISKSNTHISFYLAGLMAGDKIKLRATITDTSIFHNVDHYPDTGWIVMNVLPPIVSVENDNSILSYELAQNYPNPFNPFTTIRYQIPEPVFVTIKAYDVLGNEIETLVKEEKIAGSHEIHFDGSGLTSGIYYYRITTENFSRTKKMILLK